MYQLNARTVPDTTIYNDMFRHNNTTLREWIPSLKPFIVNVTINVDVIQVVLNGFKLGTYALKMAPSW